MEADWEFEAGGEAPVIEACWPGFVDLRQYPERARELPETAALPALAEALVRLNGADSPVWTAKCDFWPSLAPGEFDAYEMEAAAASATHAAACYIDLLPRSDQQWPLPAMAEKACKAICARLRAAELAQCRVDLLVRRALITPELQDLGITAYITACGASPQEAKDVLQQALGGFAHALCAHSTLQ